MKLHLTDEQVAEIWKDAPECADQVAIEIIARYYVKDFDKYGNQHLEDKENKDIWLDRPKEKYSSPLIAAIAETCVNLVKEKPVNEACLFKPVLFSDEADHSQAEQGIFIGFAARDERQFIYGAPSNNGYGCDGQRQFYYAKRIPGYDYGD
jgi:hypothetical protein